MGNTVTAEKLLQQIDEKLKMKSDLYRARFYRCLNKHSIKDLEFYKRWHTTYRWSVKEIISLGKKAIQQCKDEICLLRLDLQIEETDETTHQIINYYAQIFYIEFFEKICTLEFSKNDYITEKWFKELCEKLVNRSDFYAQKAERILTISKMKKSKNKISDRLPTYEDVIREDFET